MTDNQHPADELFELRKQKSIIQRRINVVRELLLELPPEERLGQEYEAKVRERESVRFNAKALIAEMGEQWVATRSVKSISQQVTLSRIKSEQEKPAPIEWDG